MTFAWTFLKLFFIGMFYMFPILALLLAVIVLLGLIIGRLEHWAKLDALYYAFITATTVGYGDLRPTSGRAKVLAILIALTGLVLTGFIVSVGIHAVAYSFSEHHLLEKFGVSAGRLLK